MQFAADREISAYFQSIGSLGPKPPTPLSNLNRQVFRERQKRENFRRRDAAARRLQVAMRRMVIRRRQARRVCFSAVLCDPRRPAHPEYPPFVDRDTPMSLFPAAGPTGILDVFRLPIALARLPSILPLIGEKDGGWRPLFPLSSSVETPGLPEQHLPSVAAAIDGLTALLLSSAPQETVQILQTDAVWRLRVERLLFSHLVLREAIARWDHRHKLRGLPTSEERVQNIWALLHLLLPPEIPSSTPADEHPGKSAAAVDSSFVSAFLRQPLPPSTVKMLSSVLSDMLTCLFHREENRSYHSFAGILRRLWPALDFRGKLEVLSAFSQRHPNVFSWAEETETRRGIPFESGIFSCLLATEFTEKDADEVAEDIHMPSLAAAVNYFFKEKGLQTSLPMPGVEVNWTTEFVTNLLPVICTLFSNPLNALRAKDFLPSMMQMVSQQTALVILPLLTPATFVYSNMRRRETLLASLGLSDRLTIDVAATSVAPSLALLYYHRVTQTDIDFCWRPLKPLGLVVDEDFDVMQSPMPVALRAVFNLLRRRLLSQAREQKCRSTGNEKTIPGYVTSALSWEEEDRLFGAMAGKILSMKLQPPSEEESSLCVFGTISLDARLVMSLVKILYIRLSTCTKDRDLFFQPEGTDCRAEFDAAMQTALTSDSFVLPERQGPLSLPEFLWIVRYLHLLHCKLVELSFFMGSVSGPGATAEEEMQREGVLWERHQRHEEEKEASMDFMEMDDSDDFQATEMNESELPNYTVRGFRCSPAAAVCSGCAERSRGGAAKFSGAANFPLGASNEEKKFLCDAFGIGDAARILLCLIVNTLHRLRITVPEYSEQIASFSFVLNQTHSLLRTDVVIENLALNSANREAKMASSNWSSPGDVVRYGLRQMVVAGNVTVPFMEKVLLLVPFSLPLQTRMAIFHYLLYLRKYRHRSLQNVETGMPDPGSTMLAVNRDDILNSMLGQLLNRDALTYLRSLTVQFYTENSTGGVNSEPGLDGGGLSREFLRLALASLTDPEKKLFVHSSDNHIRPLPAELASTFVRCDVLKVVGRLIGRCFIEKIVPDVGFDFCALGLLLYGDAGPLVMGSPLEWLHCVDEEAHKSLHNLLKEDFSPDRHRCELTFVAQRELQEFSVPYSTEAQNALPAIDDRSELILNGATVPVTKSNVERFVRLMAKYYCFDKIATALDVTRAALNEVLPLDWCRIFTIEEAAKLFGSHPSGFDVDEFRQHVQIRGGLDSLPTEVEWLLNVLRRFSPEEQSHFLAFVTSVSTPPTMGFRHLTPPFTIVISDSTASTALPSAHTCGHVLYLPKYKSEAELESRLRLAIENTKGFYLQ